jgi:transposase
MEFQTKSTSKEIYQYCFKRRERTIQKNAKEIISNVSKEEGFTVVVVEDESIFIHDAVVRRRMWVPEGKRPIVVTTGSHQKTCVFGALCIDGRQFFRQYNAFDCYTFLDYLKKLQNKFHKVMLFLDKAPQHYRSIKVRKHLEENKMNMKVEYLPKGSPEFNAVEECWRQGKDDLLISKYYPRLYNLKHAIANYYRIKRFKLDIAKYLLRNVA